MLAFLYSVYAFAAPISDSMNQKMSERYDLMLLCFAGGALALLVGMILFATGRLLARNARKKKKKA